MGDDFERCDLNGDGEIRGRLEAQALWRHSIGEAGLQPTPRAWHDPLVISNALFALAALQWCRRGHRRQGALLLGCALSSWVYHAGGEATPGWPLLVDECFAYTTFAHTLLFPARRLDRSSVPGLCVSPRPPAPPPPRLSLTQHPRVCRSVLIAMALVVWRIASPLRGHNVGYSFWHTLWHVLVFLGQVYICASIPAATR